MLPQFGYIVAQAGADSLGQSNKMYSNRSASPPNVKQEHEPFQGRHDPYSRSPKTTAATLPTSHPTPLTAPPASRPASYLPPPPASAAAPNHYIYSSSPPLANAPPTASGKEEHYYYDQRPPADYRPSPWQPPSTFAYPPPAMYPPPPHWQHTHPSSPPTSFYPPIAYASPYVAPPPVSHDVYPLQYTASNPPVHSFLPTSNPPPGSPSIDLSEKESPYYAKQRWYQDETTIEPPEPKMLRQLREYNDLMSWMDSDFWDHHDQVYQEKSQALQKELQSIQDGDHPLFGELVADLEAIRDQTIEDALCFETYQLSMTRQDYELNTLMIEEEYQLETNHLTEAIMGVIDDCRKSIKDDRDDADAIDIHSIFQDAYARLKQKRSLRKRTAMHHHSDHRGSPARLESRGRRQKNTPAPHNIHAPLSTKEEDEVENDFLQMKGISPKRNGNPSRR